MDNSDSHSPNSTTVVEVTLSNIREFIQSRGGKVRYAELFDHFRDGIVDDATDCRFQEILSTIATKKYQNSNVDEWIILKKKYMNSDPSFSSSPASSTGFLTSTLQRTKQNLSKFSRNAFHLTSTNSLRDVGTSSSAHNVAVSAPLSPNSNDNAISRSSTALHSNAPSSATVLGEHHHHRRLFFKASNQSLDRVHEINSNSKKSSSLMHILNVDQIFHASRNGHKKELHKQHSAMSLSPKRTSSSSVNTLNNESTSSGTMTGNFIKSVKEQVKKMNRLHTEIEFNRNKTGTTANTNNKFVYGSSNYRPSSATTKTKQQHVELESFDIATLSPIEKEWITACSKGDYMEITRISSKNAYLVQKKDPFSGVMYKHKMNSSKCSCLIFKSFQFVFNLLYTCAHWACKHGNVEILKLIASTLENDTKTNPKLLRINHLINSRSGYTCLHLAYLFNHTYMVPYLKTYGAEGFLDFSGKMPIDYSIGPNDHQNQMNCDASIFIKRHTSAFSSKASNKPMIISKTVAPSSNDHQFKQPFTMIRSQTFSSSTSSSNSSLSSASAENSNEQQQQPLKLNTNENSTSSSFLMMPPPKTTFVIKNKPKVVRPPPPQQQQA